MVDTATHGLRGRMAAALPHAMRHRDRVVVTALRSTLGVLANAESVPSGPPSRSGHGRPGEPTRQQLSELEVAAIVAAEAEQREQVAESYAARGDDARARRMLAEAEVLRAFLA